MDLEASPRPRRRWRRRLLTTLVVIAALVAASYGGAALAHVPPPHTIVRLLTTAPSEQGQLFATRTVTASSTPSDLPAGTESLDLAGEVPWKGKQMPLRDVLGETKTNAFVVLHGGEVVEEWYADGKSATTRFSSWSVAKSVISLLVGQAIGRGELSEDDRLVDLVPELAGGSGGYDDITVRDLLDMASGVDVAENYREYWPFTGTARLFLSTDLPGYVAAHRSVTYAPGSDASYRSVDTQLLGMILTEVEGKPLAEQLTERLWQPLGAEADATWNLDREGGLEKAFCCINAVARDYARIGQLVLDDGMAGGQQLVPTAWIDRISTLAPREVSGWGYSAQWWHAPGSDEDLCAVGVYGQYIYVNPAADTVIVKLSDYGTEQDELETVDMMRAIAADLGAS
jgi:CubicO group peptidase (beta-lactamase class C family)